MIDIYKMCFLLYFDGVYDLELIRIDIKNKWIIV